MPLATWLSCAIGKMSSRACHADVAQQNFTEPVRKTAGFGPFWNFYEHRWMPSTCRESPETTSGSNTRLRLTNFIEANTDKNRQFRNSKASGWTIPARVLHLKNLFQMIIAARTSLRRMTKIHLNWNEKIELRDRRWPITFWDAPRTYTSIHES